MTLDRTSIYVPNSSDFADLAHIDDACDAVNNLKSNVMERFRVVTKSSNYTAVAADEGSVILCTSGITLSLTAAATLGTGWSCWVRNEAGSAVTIDPNGSETVDGLTTITVGNRETVLLVCDGSNFKTLAASVLPNIVNNLVGSTVTVDHRGDLMTCVGPLTVPLQAAATLGEGWFCYFRNTGSGLVTLDPNGSETINGVTTFLLSAGASVLLICTGSGFYTVGYTLPAVSAISSNTTLTGAHAGGLVNASSTITLSLTAVATLGSGWFCDVTNSGTGVITIDPNGSETVDGLASINLGPNSGCRIYGNGSSFFTVGRPAEYIVLQDTKTAGTDGGTFTAVGARTRDLNTEVIDTGNNCSLASNQFTLQAGTYRILASAPAYQVGRHQAFLRNITDASDVFQGTSEAASGSTQTRSVIAGQFSISASKVFEIQHRCNTSRSTDGFGVSTGYNLEVYTSVELWKVV